jgi:hypothetical protein
MRITDVFHEPIKVNLNQKISIPHKSHLRSTTFRFHYAEIHEQGYDFSKDLEVKASSGRPVAPCHLQIGLSALIAYENITDRK